MDDKSISGLDESVSLSTPSKSTSLSNIGVFDPFDQIFSSTPIHQGSLHIPSFTSNSCDSIDKAELSDRVGVAGISRLARPIETIVTILNELRKVENNSLLVTHLSTLETGIKDLICKAEELIKNDDSQTCHNNKLEGLYQDIDKIKRELESKKKVNVSLSRENQVLSEHKDQLEEKNRELLTRNDKLKAQLVTANTEKKELEEILEIYEPLVKKTEADLSKVVKENRLLKQERNELNNEYKHISRSEETKDLGIQTEDIDTLQERAELSDGYRVELEEKLKIANEDNKRLTLSNSISKEMVKQLEEKLRLKASQPNFTEKKLFDEIKEADQQQIGTLDKSTQIEIKYECNFETTVPIKNEELSNATQDFGKNTSELTRLTEELKGTKVQLAKKVEEISNLNGQVTQLTEESSQLREKFDEIKAQLEKDSKQATQTEQSQRTKLNDLTSIVSQPNSKKSELETQLTEKEKMLDTVQKSLVDKDVEVTQSTSETNQLNATIGTLNTQLTKQKEALDSANQEVNRLKSIEDQLKNTIEKLEGIKNQHGKNKKFLRASIHSKRQYNYASVSFVLSGAFAVGASLTMFHLAICISLAVAALTFLAVGCYCLYKANTALSNVEVKNGVNPAVVEV
ncbi:TomO hydrophobic C-terminal domain-containing protein [Wolbachia endosymbiont (group A) of Philonthus cognatus]|uniref:TomO hydrophobic C-terminal domain-containing protein n=1 Tax=Wolbachia endosymbiont (group A) of Philonthus cognatus TaxID=2954046 RepID=UPI00222F3FD2|nr:hypothetical protein [Wolbachia endosymbiont (group A) of Philonthus cognatus]